MTIGGIQSAMVGFSLFDAWAASVEKTNKSRQHVDPLVHAAFAAFEGYVQGQEAIHAGMIAGAAYMLNAKGTGRTAHQQQATRPPARPQHHRLITKTEEQKREKFKWALLPF